LEWWQGSVFFIWREDFVKALRLHEVGSLQGIRWDDVAEPVVGDRDVLVRITSTSLNYRDYGFITGAYSLVKPPPIILGSDAAGVVESVGASVSSFKVGDRVISLLRQNWLDGDLNPQNSEAQLGATVDGVFSELYSFPETGLVRAPAGMGSNAAATLPTAGLTAFRVLTELGLRSGQRVVVQGTGAVSLFTLQIAARMGAHVLATTGRDTNTDLLKQLGAAEVINYRAHPDWHAAVRRATDGLGADIIVDVAGGAGLALSVDAVAINGRIAVIGFLEGSQSTIDLVAMIRKNVSLHAFTTGNRQTLRQFVQWLEANPLEPVIGGVFTNYESAFSAFAQRDKVGKIVVKHA
jgi:NADPH:quinone reductase-like Zn-dependent oxidoreductase